MWAQLLSMRLKPGKDDALPGLFDQLRAMEQPGSGLLRTLTLRDQKDPSHIYTLVLFDSEESARARERDERRAEGLKAVRATMAELFDGPPEFVDLAVLSEFAP